MWEQFEEQLVPLFEFLGIPLIIITPIMFILYILFKIVLPKMLTRNSNATGAIVANIVAQLFGEGSGLIKGVEELEVVKLIKTLPNQTENAVDTLNHKLNATCELIALMSEAIMSERLIKPQSSQKLQEVKKKSQEIIEMNVSEDVGEINGEKAEKTET